MQARASNSHDERHHFLFPDFTMEMRIWVQSKQAAFSGSL